MSIDPWKWLEEAGIGVEGVARHLGCGPRSVYRYFNRERVPPKEAMAKLAELSGGKLTANDFYALPPSVPAQDAATAGTGTPTPEASR